MSDKNNTTKEIFPTIIFPDQESKKEFDEKMKENCWSIIEETPNININEVKRKRFKVIK